MKLLRYRESTAWLGSRGSKVSIKSINDICRKYRINNYVIDMDGYVNVNGDVSISRRKLTRIPLKFGNVTGNFSCHGNELVSLLGCPISVGGDFTCYKNKLRTMEGSPKSVGGGFNCDDNQLVVLEGCPKSVGGFFSCDNNELTTLEGGPKNTGNYFSCDNNRLTSMVGCPVANYHILCNNNNILDFIGFPESWDGNLHCSGNPIGEICNLFPPEDMIRSIYWINEFEVIRGNDIILDRLEMCYYEMGMDMPDNIELDNYNLI